MDIKEFLKIFVNPPTSKNDVVCMSRLTAKKGEMDSTDKLGIGSLLLPEQDKKFHLFNASPIKETLLVDSNDVCVCSECSWVMLGDYIEEGVLAYVYNSNGAIYPLSMVYAINIGNQVFIAVEQARIRDIDSRSDRLFIRTINISFGYSESEWIGFKYLTLQGMSTLSTMLSDRAGDIGLRMIVDGRIINNNVLLPSYIGKAVDIIFDGSIKEVRKVALEHKFLSELSHCQKFIIHSEYNTDVVNIATTEIIIYKQGVDSSGLVVGHELEKNVNLITNNDLSVPVETVLHKEALIDGKERKVFAKVVVRHYEIERSLITDANRIDILTQAAEYTVMRNLLGEGIPQWSAQNLENSFYSRALKHDLKGSLPESHGSLGFEGLKTAFSVGFVKVTSLMRQEGVNTGRSGWAVIIHYDHNGELIRTIDLVIGVSKKITVTEEVWYVEVLPGRSTGTAFHRYEALDHFEHRFEGDTQSYRRSICGMKWEFADNDVQTSAGVTTRVRGHKEISIYNKDTILVKKLSVTIDKGIFWFDAFTEESEPSTMLLFVNNKSLVRYVDFNYINGKITIINIEYIGSEDSTIECVFIACGWNDVKDPDDNGFIANGLWSDNNKWDPARNHLARYVAGGRVYDFSETLSDEGWGNSDSEIVVNNGDQYCISDSYTTFPSVSNIKDIKQKSFELNMLIREALSGSSDHVCKDNNVISGTIPIYSPYLSRLVYQLKNDGFNSLISKIDNGDIITGEDIILESNLITELDFNKDIINVGVDQRYISIFPTLNGMDLNLSYNQAFIYSHIENLAKEKVMSTLIIN